MPSTGQREAGVLDHKDGEVRVMRSAETTLVVTEQSVNLGSGEHWKAG